MRFYWPTLGMTLPYIVNQFWICVIDGNVPDRVHHQSCSQCIAATEFAHKLPSVKKFCDKPVTREKNSQSARIIVPNLIGGETAGRQTSSFFGFEKFTSIHILFGDSRLALRRLAAASKQVIYRWCCSDVFVGR